MTIASQTQLLFSVQHFLTESLSNHKHQARTQDRKTMAAVMQKRSHFEIPQINHSTLHIIQQQSQKMEVNLFTLKGGMDGTQ